MTRLTAIVVACAAGLIGPANSAHAAPGDPIPGTEVGLEHDPGELDLVAKGTTDREGNVTFNNLKPGRYRITLADTSKFKVPARVVISGVAAAPLVSELIFGGKAGTKAYALGGDGRRLVVEIAPPTSQAGPARVSPVATIRIKVETAR